MEIDNVIDRKLLEDILITVDKNNPKYELNFCYVNEEHLVSTNTRALTVAEHGLKIEKPFYLERLIIDKALKERKAVYYSIAPSKITAYDRDLYEIITFSIEKPYDKSTFNYPDYKRIFPDGWETKLSFVDNTQINGIFAVHKVDINPTFIPKTKNGHIHINEKNLPVMISDADHKVKTLIMPIIDRFKEFDEKGYL